MSKLPGLHCRDSGDALPTVLEVELQAEVQPVKLRLHSEARLGPGPSAHVGPVP